VSVVTLWLQIGAKDPVDRLDHTQLAPIEDENDDEYDCYCAAASPSSSLV